MNDLAKLLGPVARRISNLLARGGVSAVNAATKLQTLQLRLMAGERKDDVEHFEPFGFTSCPLPGAEHVTVFFDGDRSHAATIVVADRRYRLQGLQGGEVALHDAYGNKVHLKADGTLAVVAGTQVEITSPLVTISGDLQVAGTITAAADVVAAGISLATHTHGGVAFGGSNTSEPN